MVISELDYIKDTSSNGKLKNSVLNSIKFINTLLENKNEKLVGMGLPVFDYKFYRFIALVIVSVAICHVIDAWVFLSNQ